MARYQHPYLVFDRHESLAPKDLEGKRVGVRSYSVTTGAWIRGILAEDYGVDLSRIQWVTFEEAHVAEFRDPPNVQRAPAGKDINAMLLAGELDAAILGAMPQDAQAEAGDPRPGGRGQEVGREARRDPAQPPGRGEEHGVEGDGGRGLRPAAGQQEGRRQSRRCCRTALDANRRNLEVAIDCAYKQKMIPRRFTVDELFE